MHQVHVRQLTSLPAEITGAGDWENALQKARAFVEQLTIEEKAGMVTGMNNFLLTVQIILTMLLVANGEIIQVPPAHVSVI